MLKLDPHNHNPTPKYLFSLVEKAGINSFLAARLCGVNRRNFRHMLSGKVTMPYAVQFCLEYLAENPPKKEDYDWSDFRD